MQLIFNIEDSIQLLPHFLQHYTALGFDRFHVGVAYGEKNPLYAEIQSTCAPFDCIIGTSVTGDFTGRADSKAADALRQKYVAPGDWYGIADLDEFFDIAPYNSLADLVRACEAAQARAVVSELLDRITADGTIPDRISPGPVTRQFPLACQLTRNIAGGYVRKVILAQGSVPINSGHHVPRCKSLRVQGGVHHYKWHGNVIERLQRRNALYQKLGLPWWIECQRLLDYLSAHNGRIPIADPRLECRRIG